MKHIPIRTTLNINSIILLGPMQAIYNFTRTLFGNYNHQPSEKQNQLTKSPINNMNQSETDIWIKKHRMYDNCEKCGSELNQICTIASSECDDCNEMYK